MDLSQKHTDARTAAARLPALEASLALLVEDTQLATIALYAAPRPSPGAAASGSALVVIPLLAGAGMVLEQALQISLYVPLQATNDAGGTPTWGRITDGAGDWWADASVSDTDGDGEIQLETLPLIEGATTRLVSAVVGG